MNKNELDKKILERFDCLIKDADRVYFIMDNENNSIRHKQREAGISSAHESELCGDIFFKVKTNVLSLLHFLPSTGSRLSQVIDEVQKIESKITGINKLRGILQALRVDYEAGFLKQYSSYIEAQIEANYFQQAEALLEPHGEHTYISAAVLLGAVLENSLRILCQRQSPEILVIKPNGEYKMMTALIDDLKQAGVFNELKAKQLRAWADIRNKAAHGQFEEFKRTDVEQMLVGVRTFLADHLG